MARRKKFSFGFNKNLTAQDVFAGVTRKIYRGKRGPKPMNKRKQFRKKLQKPKKKVDTKGMPTKKKQGTLFVPDSQKHWQKHSRKPNNNPSTRGKQMK
jgi:hypothetical protein